MFFNSILRLSLNFASNEERGSSIKYMFGLRTRARPIATLCISPPDNSVALFLSLLDKITLTLSVRVFLLFAFDLITDFIIDKIEASISSLGGRLEDIVRTRIFVKNINDWKKVAETHGKRFEDINPANTLVQANLVGDDYLVEIEAEAIISE